MTKDKDEKAIIRARMERTGESYAAARAKLSRDETHEPAEEAPPEPGGTVTTTQTAASAMASVGDTGSAWHLVLALRDSAGVAGRVLRWLGLPADLKTPPVTSGSPAAATWMGAMHAGASFALKEKADIDTGRLLRGAVTVFADAQIPAEQLPFAARIQDADLVGLCAAAERELGPEDDDQGAESTPSLFTRFSGQARMVIVYAQEEARGLDHHYIGTEHLLLGLLREGGTAATVVASGGVDLEGTRRRILEAVGRGGQPAGSHIPFTPRTKNLLAGSAAAADELQSEFIRPEHLLLALVDEGDGIAAQFLTADGLTASVVRERVMTALADLPPDAPPG